MKKVVACLVGSFLLVLVVKDWAEDREIKKSIEADPYSQSVLRATDAVNMIGRHSFVDLDREEQRKVVMKCTEAYSLATLRSAVPPNGRDDPLFCKYLCGLKIVVHADYMMTSVQPVDAGIDMIRDYLWSQYGEYH